MLEGCTRNRHVYDKFARELEGAGYKRSWSQCRDKLKKLKGDYRKVRDHNNETGRERKVWKYFEEMDAILGTKPATRPEIVIDTLADKSNQIVDVAVVNSEVETVKMKKEVENSKKCQEKTDVEEKCHAKTEENKCQVNTEAENKCQVKSESEKKCQVKADIENDIKKKKMLERKKRSKESGSKVERALAEVVEIVTEAQSKSDQLFVSLEEKRMKLDEQML